MHGIDRGLRLRSEILDGGLAFLGIADAVVDMLRRIGKCGCECLLHIDGIVQLADGCLEFADDRRQRLLLQIGQRGIGVELVLQIIVGFLQIVDDVLVLRGLVGHVGCLIA